MSRKAMKLIDPRSGEMQGVSRTTIVEAGQHVGTAEQYPFMQGTGWLEHHVMEARFLLARLPNAERPRIAGVIAVAKGAIHPKHAIEILMNVVLYPHLRGQRYIGKASALILANVISLLLAQLRDPRCPILVLQSSKRRLANSHRRPTCSQLIH